MRRPFFVESSDRHTMSYRHDEKFRPEERLLERSDFLSTQSRGRRTSSRHLIVYAAPNEREYSRLGITASTKVGKAHVRNWWKRRIREAYRRQKLEFPAGFDFVVIVKASVARPDFEELADELVEVLENAARRSQSE